MYTVSVDGCAVDFGAHWVAPTQRRALALAEELGIAREPQYLDGTHLVSVGGRRREFTGSTPVVSLLGTAETALGIAGVELRRRLVHSEQPWRSRLAKRWDSYTLAHWMSTLRSTAARSTFTIVARTVFGAEPSELSFLYFLWYAQCAGGLPALMNFEGGAQDSHLVGGTQQVCDLLAAELGEAVVLGAPVSSVAHDAAGALVTSGERTVRAGSLVVAVSPAIAGRIEFDPPLPPAREALAQRMPMGAYMKSVALYERAWWRDRGLSGLAFADRGPVQMVVDVSPPTGRPGVLAGFVTGAPARTLGGLEGTARRETVLKAIAHMVAPEAAHSASYADVNWHEQRWSRGAPVGLMPPGTLTTLGGVLREPVGPVYWAGTETATEWNGYMEGAIQAGQRAADEVTA